MHFGTKSDEGDDDVPSMDRLNRRMSKILDKNAGVPGGLSADEQAAEALAELALTEAAAAAEKAASAAAAEATNKKDSKPSKKK